MYDEFDLDKEYEMYHEGLIDKLKSVFKKDKKEEPEHKSKKDIIEEVNKMKSVNIQQCNLQKAYNEWYYTIEGVEDIQWVAKFYNKLLTENGIGKPKAWYTATGAQVNREFGFKGKHAYNSNFHFLFFPTDGLSKEIAGFKQWRGDRWFTDIVDNTLRHMKNGD